MGKKDSGQVEVFTSITFSNDDITVIFKNVHWSIFSDIDKDVVIDEIMYKQWFMFGLYEDVELLGHSFKMVGKTKKKIELIYLYSNE